MVLLIECLDYLCDTRDTVVLVGDLNLPNIDWFLLDSPADNIHSVFLEFCTEFGLYQFVDSATRKKPYSTGWAKLSDTTLHFCL